MTGYPEVVPKVRFADELTGRFSERRFGMLLSQPEPKRQDRALFLFSRGLRFPRALGTRQELRHVLVLGCMVRPPFSGRVPAVVANRHIDTVVDQELCRFIVPADGAFVQDASWLMRAPVGIDVGSALQRKDAISKCRFMHAQASATSSMFCALAGVQCRFRKTEESLAG